MPHHEVVLPLPGSLVDAVRHLNRVALVLAVAAQCIALYAPGPAVPSSGVPGLDKLTHLAMFFVVALLATRERIPSRWVAGLLLVQAVGSELAHAYLVPSRTGDPLDVAADLVGMAAGMLLGRRRHGRAGLSSGPQKAGPLTVDVDSRERR